jgi:hypothetical protein
MMLLLSILTPIENVLTWALEWLHTTIGLTWAWSIAQIPTNVQQAEPAREPAKPTISRGLSARSTSSPQISRNARASIPGI